MTRLLAHTVGRNEINLCRPAAAADPVLGAFTEKLLSLEENNVRDKITIDAGE